MLTCELHVHSDMAHLQPIYTGFAILHRAGAVRVRQRIVREAKRGPRAHLRGADHPHLSVLVNGEQLLHYDVHDGPEIDDEKLASADWYFKRSYLPSLAATLPHGRKLRPLGLNYAALADGIDLSALQRARLHPPAQAARTALTSLCLDRALAPLVRRPFLSARVRDLVRSPDPAAPPRVLFMTRAWDPSAFLVAERERIGALNEMRAACVRLLRREFGTAFFGGFMAEPYALRRYADVVIADESIARKPNYLRLLAHYPVCITTAGLHDSLGWKLAEYVAAAKAIVTEELAYTVPGPFEAGRNYLAFATPEGCAEATAVLVNDAGVRVRMMEENASYFRAYGIPQAIVLRSLLHAFPGDEVLQSFDLGH